MKYVCGIDPGLDGALFFVNCAGFSGEAIDMPFLTLARGGKKRRQVDPHRLDLIIKERLPGHAFIEDVWARPNSLYSSGSLLLSAGIMIGILASNGIPYTSVSPQKWKNAMQTPASKSGARSRASQLLPLCANQWPLVKHDGRAEAALIALYGIRSFYQILTEQAAE